MAKRKNNTATENAATDTATVAAPTAPIAAESVQIVRTLRNGVATRRAGGKCAIVWDECDRITAAGELATVAKLRAWAQANGTNVSNAAQEFYCWRKHNGMSGRVEPKAVTATVDAPAPSAEA